MVQMGVGKAKAVVNGVQDLFTARVDAPMTDLLLVDANPLDDLSVLADRARIHMVIQGGTIVADRRP